VVAKVIPWLLLVAVAWFGGHQFAQNRALDAERDALNKRNAELEQEAGRVDTVYQTDTLRLTRTRTVTDSLILTDTVFSRPAVTTIVERERLACDAVIATCEARVAYRDSIIANLDSAIRVQKQRGGNWKSKLGWLLAGGAAGVIIAR